MNRTVKRVALIVCVVFVCLVLLASCFVFVKHGHECVGNNCNVCSVIDAVKKILDGLTVLALSATLLVVVQFGIDNFSLFFKKSIVSTLISLKVKLSN